MSYEDAVQAGSIYPSTHWSQVRLAADPGELEGEGALNQLLSRYYEPLLGHIQYKFRLTEDVARDVLQGFMHRKVLERNILQLADRTRGKFRTFLLASLDRFIIDEFRAQTAMARRCAGGLVALDDVQGELPALAEVDPFDRDWALAVIAEAERETAAFYAAKGRPEAWVVFREAIVLPLKHGVDRPEFSELAVRCGLGSARQVSNVLVTVKRQFGKIMRGIVRCYVDSESDVDQEIRELVSALSVGH